MSWKFANILRECCFKKYCTQCHTLRYNCTWLVTSSGAIVIMLLSATSPGAFGTETVTCTCFRDLNILCDSEHIHRATMLLQFRHLVERDRQVWQWRVRIFMIYVYDDNAVCELSGVYLRTTPVAFFSCPAVFKGRAPHVNPRPSKSSGSYIR